MENKLQNNEQQASKLNEHIIKDEDPKDLQDWSEKYNVTIEVLKEEYLLYRDSIKNADEKVNKYLVVLSIIFAALFTVLSGSIIENLKFSTSCLNIVNLLSITFIIFLLIGIHYGYRTFNAVLKTLNLVETRRMPNMLQELEKKRRNKFNPI